MESLPSDIILEIVSRVPAESVLECKLVCKKWGSLTRGSDFATKHLNHQLNHIHGGGGGGDNDNDGLATKVDACLFFACRTDHPDEYKTLLFHGGQLSDRISFDDEKYIYSQNLTRIYHPPLHDQPLYNQLVGSCNGLVCALQHHNLILDPIYICNPLTREYVHLPELVVNKQDVVDPDCFRILEGGEVDMRNHIACGFGYVRSTNEYKVVRIHYLGLEEGNVEVYTLGSGCGWRAIGKVSYRLDSTWKNTGIYANDAIYWTSGNKVVTFDLAEEKFLLFVPPCMQNLQHGVRCGLVALGRHLCLYVHKSRMEIWSLRKSNDWCMEFDIDYEAVVGSREWNLQPIVLTKNGEIIFLYDESVLYCYNTKTTILKMISEETDCFEDVEAIAHVNTFASLEAMGENSKRYTVRTQFDDVTDDLERVSLGEKIDTTRFSLR